MSHESWHTGFRVPHFLAEGRPRLVNHKQYIELKLSDNIPGIMLV